MYRGVVRLGDEIAFRVQCYNSSGVPADPDACPKIDIYSGSGKPLSGKSMPVLDKATTTGLFELRVFLGVPFAVGAHLASIRYKVSSHHGILMARFDIVPGGSTTGEVVSMFAWELPNANYLVQQRTSGQLYRGKNPRE